MRLISLLIVLAFMVGCTVHTYVDKRQIQFVHPSAWSSVSQHGEWISETKTDAEATTDTHGSLEIPLIP